jgi:hypothetical protein
VRRLQKNKLVLVSFVLVEPAGTDDGIWQTAMAHKPLCPALLVVRLGGLVIGACPLGDADCRHKRDAHMSRFDCHKDIADAAIVDDLRTNLTRTRRNYG